MKANRLICLLLFLMLGVAVAQQTNSSSRGAIRQFDPTQPYEFVGQQTNSSGVATNPFARFGPRVITNSVTIGELRTKAEKGDAEAQFELGTNFWTTDEDEAVKWFTKAAEQNYKGAFYYMGSHFDNESAPTYNPSKAFEFYLRGAKLGDATCAFFTGQAYIFGDGTTTNTEEGLRWVRKSADQGWEGAQYALAEWYYEGKVIPKNLTNAIYWYQKAAEQGDKDTQVQLYAQSKLG